MKNRTRFHAAKINYRGHQLGIPYIEICSEDISIAMTLSVLKSIA